MTDAGNIFYTDKDLQAKHTDLFRSRTLLPIPQIFPPDVSPGVFNEALTAFKDILGSANVLTGEDLAFYVDPFELWEDTNQRHIPSAAIR